MPLCIDSSVPGALEEGLKACEGRPLLNSVTGEEERLERVLPLVKKYNVPVVAISNDDTGISQDPDVRFAVAKKIVERAADFGIPAHDIVVDPLVMPVGAMASAGQQVFALVRRLREELGVNTTCGASNISFGLPHRHGINAAFLPMAIGAGMTSAIMNPVRQVEMEAIRAANFLMNHDPNGGEWIRFSKVIEAVEGGMSFAEASRLPRRRRPRAVAAGAGARERLTTLALTMAAAGSRPWTLVRLSDPDGWIERDFRGQGCGAGRRDPARSSLDRPRDRARPFRGRGRGARVSPGRDGRTVGRDLQPRLLPRDLLNEFSGENSDFSQKNRGPIAQ